MFTEWSHQLWPLCNHSASRARINLLICKSLIDLRLKWRSNDKVMLSGMEVRVVPNRTTYRSFHSRREAIQDMMPCGATTMTDKIQVRNQELDSWHHEIRATTTTNSADDVDHKWTKIVACCKGSSSTRLIVTCTTSVLSVNQFSQLKSVAIRVSR